MRLLTIPVLLALAGCASPAGGGDAGATTGPTTGPTSSASGDGLLIVLDRGDGTEPERYTLDCSIPDGDHPDPATACAHLATLEDPFAALPADLVCTEQYGGPQTARVTGRWDGSDVDVELSRVNGCYISQWDALGPVLPPVAGVGGD